MKKKFGSFFWGAASSSTPPPAEGGTLGFVENFPLHQVFNYNRSNWSAGTLSVHAINIPGNVLFNFPVIVGILTGTTARTISLHLGLYSMNNGTLSLANSASRSLNEAVTGTNWLSFVTSATQNMTPGQWYLGFNILTAGTSQFRIGQNVTSMAPGNAFPGAMLRGRMTASTNAMPASIATSDLDRTGNDAELQTYILIGA